MIAVKVPLSPWLLAALVVLTLGALGAFSLRTERAGSARHAPPPADTARFPRAADSDKARCPAGTLEDNGVCIPVAPLPIKKLPTTPPAPSPR